VFEGVRKQDFALGNKSYVEYTDRQGFLKTLRDTENGEWVCLKTENPNATKIS
jgi:hypothetical protein